MFSSLKSSGLIVFILSLGLISFWQAQKDVSINSVNSEEFECKDLAALDKKCQDVGAVINAPPQVHNEINELSESYWSQYLCRKNNSSYTTKDNTLYELKEVRFNGIIYEPTPANKLNNIERTGTLSVDSLTSRYYNNDGKWDKWSDYRPYLSVGVEKVNGQWQVEKQERYTSPDCNNLPQ